MKLMHNGILEVDHVRPEEVTQLDDYLPSPIPISLDHIYRKQ